jgi:hypothetical protein
MIYDFPDPHAPIRQGDIFRSMPRVQVPLLGLQLSDGTKQMDLEEAAPIREPLTAILPLRIVTAIVISQDCDVSRTPAVAMSEVRPFREVEGRARETKSPKGWASIITQHARTNQKWFYLPPDPRIGFTDKMAADFQAVTSVLREDLEQRVNLRIGRLNDMATKHFRERIGEFFRRYPYDEWYPLDKDEMKAYLDGHADAEPYPWQIPS